MPEWTLPPQAGSVPRARRLVTDALRGLPTEAMETVELLVSELVTNCVRHAHTDINLRVSRLPDQVRVEVTDRGDGEPAVKEPAPAEPHGRGLQIVEALARRWGVVSGKGGVGKTVWCTIAI